MNESSNICGIAGQDATKVFYGLHRQEVLQRPQYKRLQIGTIIGEEESIKPLAPGELSAVPYAEPTWLSEGFSAHIIVMATGSSRKPFGNLLWRSFTQKL